MWYISKKNIALKNISYLNIEYLIKIHKYVIGVGLTCKSFCEEIKCL